MNAPIDPDAIEWFRYPRLAADPFARQWLQTEALLGLASNTLDAYARGVEDFLRFCNAEQVDPLTVTRGTIARFVGDLRQHRPSPRRGLAQPVGLANATIQQRLTSIRLFFDFLVEEHCREDNPVGRGRYTPGNPVASAPDHALVPRTRTLPWIPNDDQWHHFLTIVQDAHVRTRCMVALAYDTGLRREELCTVRSDDLDPAHRLLRVRAEVAKGARQRTVPYSATSGELLRAYLAHRRTLSAARGPLFLSESPRNYAQPITLWTWSKVVRQLALRADLPQFSTHTFRHLCLTDLARSGWDVQHIAQFAGHRNPQTTLLYIHLSGHDLAAKLSNGMAQIHTWRMQMLAEVCTSPQQEALGHDCSA